MKKIRVGIIGTGFSATFHLEALRRLSQVEVVAISGSGKQKAEQMAQKHNIPTAYGDANELIHDSNVDAIHNCTPNFLHYSYNREVLLSGKHLLSEKPLAMTSSESLELCELAQQSKGISGVCFNYRHYPLVLQAKHDIAKGELGRVNLVYGGYLQDWLLYENDYNWRLDPKLNGASRAIADIGSHWCDTVQFITGKKIVEVFADLKTVHPLRSSNEIKVNTEDYGSVLVHFEDNIQGVFTVSQVSAGRKNKLFFEIAAETGSLSWNQEEPDQLWLGKRDEANRILKRDASLLSPEAANIVHYPGGHPEGWPDAVKNMFLSFYSSISEQKQVNKMRNRGFASIKEGHRMMKIVEAIMKSHHLKQWVTIKD